MKSMTGFGSGAARSPAGEIVVEARSVNQRFLDLKLALPKELAPWELELRKAIQAVVARGRLEVYVSRVAKAGADAALEVDEALARGYVDAWKRLQKKLGLPGEIDVGFVQRCAEVLRAREAAADPEAEMPAVREALAAALRELDRARTREGKNLERDMRARVKTLEAMAAQMEERVDASLEASRRRLEERMGELLRDRVDEARIAQEAAFQVERSDVTEEIVRLRSHLGGLVELLRAAGAVGKRIEFLLQEVQREVNTIAAKSNDLKLTHLAVEAKGEVEKIREQVQNVE